MNPKVAVLIDGDNVGVEFATQVLARARQLGQPIVKRVYVDPPHLAKWAGAEEFSLCVTRVGRNSVDIMLTIDAVDLAHRADLSAFVIASSDGDFAPLARFLVERGHLVLGLGELKAPSVWRRSCTRFEVLSVPEARTAWPEAQSKQRASAPPHEDGGPAQSHATARAAPSVGGLNRDPLPIFDLEALVLEVLKDVDTPSVLRSDFGQKMVSRGVRKSDLAEGSWHKYFASRGDLFELDSPTGSGVRVSRRASRPF